MIGDILDPTHLIFILLAALLVLGPKRLPEVGRSLGKGLRDFRSAMAGIEEQSSDIFNQPSAPPTPPVPADVTAAALATQTEPAPVFDMSPAAITPDPTATEIPAAAESLAATEPATTPDSPAADATN